MRFDIESSIGTLSFGRLSVRSMLECSERLDKRERTLATEGADALSLPPDERAKILASLLDRRDLYASLVRACFTMHGARTIIEAGTEANGRTADEVMEATDPDVWTRIALNLVGATKVDEAVQGKAEATPTTG